MLEYISMLIFSWKFPTTISTSFGSGGIIYTFFRFGIIIEIRYAWVESLWIWIALFVLITKSNLSWAKRLPFVETSELTGSSHGWFAITSVCDCWLESTLLCGLLLHFLWVGYLIYYRCLFMSDWFWINQLFTFLVPTWFTNNCSLYYLSLISSAFYRLQSKLFNCQVLSTISPQEILIFFLNSIHIHLVYQVVSNESILNLIFQFRAIFGTSLHCLLIKTGSRFLTT